MSIHDPIHALAFPFTVNSGAGSVTEETDHDAYVRQLIRQVLLTSQGERINRPDFGAGIRRLLFAPNSPGVASMTQTIVYQALTRWLDSVIRVDEITATAEESKLVIGVRYTVRARGESRILNEEVTF